MELKKVLLTTNNSIPPILRLVVANKVAIERLHWVKDFRLKGEALRGWTFHLSLCEEGTCLSLWDKDTKKISHVSFPFGCILLTRSDVTKVGWGGNAGNMMLQGHLFCKPMSPGWKELKIYSEEEKQWEAFQKKGIEQSIKQCSDFVKDKAVQVNIDNIVRVLQNSHQFPDDFLTLMKAK